jgi:hypothetical protein
MFLVDQKYSERRVRWAEKEVSIAAQLELDEGKA